MNRFENRALDDKESIQPVSLHAHAEDNIRYIRDLMEGATSFTSVSGKGIFLAGASASIAALVAEQQISNQGWFLTWNREEEKRWFQPARHVMQRFWDSVIRWLPIEGQL